MIDPKEAPAGFVAEPYLVCDCCEFFSDPRCHDMPCMAFERKDKTDVQFRKIEKKEEWK